MAFVNRSKRDMQLSPLEASSMGPDYYNKGDRVLMIVQQAQVPFGVSERKFSAVKREEQALGPGSYEICDKKRSFNTLVVYDDRVEDGSNNGKPEILNRAVLKRLIAFDTSENRFKADYRNGNPGPGSYDIQPKNSHKANNNVLKTCGNSIVGSPYRVVSIPSRENPYGYQITDSGLMKIAKEGDTLSIFASSNDNDVRRPSSMSINALKHNHDSIKQDALTASNNLQKSLSRSITIVTTKPTSDNTEEKVHKVEERPQAKKEKKPFHKAKVIRRRIINTDLSAQFDSFCLLHPGPGYYFSETQNYKRKNSLKNYQNFGSLSKRSLNASGSSLSNSLGPGQYFKKDIYDSKGYSPKKRYYQPKTIEIYRSNYDKIKIEREIGESLIGPGTYEPHLDQRSSKSKVSLIQSNSNRFPENTSHQYPGPGEYECDVKGIASRDSTSIRRRVQTIPYQVKRVDRPSPAVGSYNPGILNSIEYVNSSKAKSSSIPFNSNLKREGSSKDQYAHLGPGCYNPYKSKKDVLSKDCPPFSSNEKRFLSVLNDNKDIGPGRYEPDSYNEWIKKSYNALFI